MIKGLKRYYKIFNKNAGPSYYIFDRETGKKIHEEWGGEKATDMVDKLNIEDAKAKGIDLTEKVETPSNYYGTRNGTPHEIAPMVRFGGTPEATN